MSKTALILVDIQNDFLPAAHADDTDGSLAVPSGNDVIEVANRLMPDYDLVIATQDWHPAEHLSFAKHHADSSIGDLVDLDGLDQMLWPEHCVQGTSGAELAAGLDQDKIHIVVQKGTDSRIDSYSGFFDNARRRATDLERLLREHDIDEVHVMGLATDYCVKFTALDAADLGFRTVLLVDGCRGVDLSAGDCDRAIEAMQEAGVEIRQTV